MRARYQANQDGFTMIEILISILLLTIVMTGTLALQVTSLRSSSNSRLSATALTLSQGRSEEFRSTTYASLQPTAQPEIACYRGNGEGLCDSRERSCNPGSTPCTSAMFIRTTNITTPGDRFIVEVNVAWRTREGVRNMGMRMERLP